MNNPLLRPFTGNLQAEALLRFPCPQRLLVVTDADPGIGLDFGAGYFGLSEFVGILRAAGHTVTTAHRNGLGPNLGIAGRFNFATAAVPVTTANYDQVWLFGFNTVPLGSTPGDNEQGVLAQFMRDGGGVFATGDHERIGAGMGLSLPRVRQMRNWASVPMTDPQRHDTVVDPGQDGVKQFEDQADAVAQVLYPVFFSNGGPPDRAGTWAVHPVLRHPSGAVDALPDHAHESECLAPTPGSGQFAGVEEWPAPVGGGARIAPVVVAVSMSAGRFITDAGKPPVLPHSFGAISAYDGDAANVGRIVCDATWHHFVNINLNGVGGGTDSAGNPRRGLYAGGQPTPAYLKIQAYFLNTVRWLAPKGRRRCWPWLQTAVVRFHPELAELGLPLPHPCPWDPLLRIGRLAAAALDQAWGPGTSADVVSGLVADSATGPTLRRLLTVGAPPAAKGEGRGEDTGLVPLDDLRRVVLGALVNLQARHLPGEPEALAKLMAGGHDKLAAEMVPEALAGAEQAIGDQMKATLAATSRLLKLVMERR